MPPIRLLTLFPRPMVYYARWIESDESRDWKKSPILKDIRDYNEVDCVSTWQATEWLRQLQESCKVAYCPQLTEASADADGAATVSKGTEAAKRRRLLADELIRKIPEQTSVRAKHADKWKI